MLAEKCPNCGAFLPVRVAGVSIRACEFCDLEVPGDVAVVEVERLTTRMPAVSPPSDATSDWLPPTPPINRVALDYTGRGVRRGVLTFVIALFLLIGGLVGGILYFVHRTTKDVLSAVPKVVPAELPPAPPAKTPPVRPEQAALTAAVQRAGGVAALDPLALLPFADGRAKAVAADALLLSVQCFPMRVSGGADLTMASGRCDYEWRSPAGTVRPPDLPVGVATDYPCIIAFDVDAQAADPDARPSRYDLRHCRTHHAVRPPRCTMADVWTRALAAGIPAGAVARVRFAGRYQSGYDPVDEADDFDVPERGRWTVSVERDGADDLRAELADDCGQAAPTADDKAVLAALKKATVALDRCFAQAASGQPAVEALEMIWRLKADARGAVDVAFADPGVDLEGIFQGDLDGIRVRWAVCAARVARAMKLPPSREVRLSLRMERGGKLVVEPPPFD